MGNSLLLMKYAAAEDHALNVSLNFHQGFHQEVCLKLKLLCTKENSQLHSKPTSRLDLMLSLIVDLKAGKMVERMLAKMAQMLRSKYLPQNCHPEKYQRC